ncbi:MAG: Hsp20/alpha crystallin family protein [Alphaproteobacteria bacterium]
MLLPMWNRERKDISRRNEEFDTPLASLQRDINRMFDEIWNRWERPLGGASGFLPMSSPHTDVAETDDEIEITAELPGLDEKDVEVTLTQDAVTIRGEKKAEHEEKRKDYYMSERSWGAFHRSIPLPSGVDTDRAEARFDRGVLTVRLPKTAEAREKVRRIEVKGS